MNLESLANELLLDMFDYFPSAQVLRIFHNLNKRFDNLIYIYFRKHRLDFRESSKKDFDIICRDNLPLIVDHIISFGLSDTDDIPQQIYLFRSYGLTFDRFENLRSLSFDNIRSSEIIIDILSECSQLIHLHLNVCYFGTTQNTIRSFIDCVWKLPKLINCYLNLSFKHGLFISIPTNISLSIEHLSVIGVLYNGEQLNELCEHTPYLRYLSFDLSNIQSVKELKTSIESITELNISYVGPQSIIIENVLQHIPNLSQLKIESLYVEIDGYEWEKIIRNYLPKLRIFQLKMKYQSLNENDKKHLIKSFQTPFWLKEHQWFIRYHFNPTDQSNMLCLYTLPYSFTKLDIQFPLQIESTYSNKHDYQSYGQVQHLLYRSSLIDETVKCHLNFPNITHLSIIFPVNNHLLSIIDKLDHLMSLEISRSKNMLDSDAQSQLQTILDHIPYLYSLKFSSWPETQLTNQNYLITRKLTPIILETKMIRQVNLRTYDCWFNDEECILFSQSSLAKFCEILFIKVQNRMNILYLINSMSKLRSLIIQSRDDNWTNYSSSTDVGNVQWLQQNLPSTCSIQRDIRFSHCIRIWIQL